MWTIDADFLCIYIYCIAISPLTHSHGLIEVFLQPITKEKQWSPITERMEWYAAIG